MKKLLRTLGLTVTLVMTMATTALAAEYRIDPPAGALFAVPTSVEELTAVGGGMTEQSGIGHGEDAAVIPPPFGSPEAEQLGSGTAQVWVEVPAAGSDAAASLASDTTVPSAPFTLVDGLYDWDGSIGQLRIPCIGVNVKVYESESLENLAKGAGHFKSTSCWDGNVGIAAHNRGVTNHFGRIHTLQIGDQMVYTTLLGTRTYEVCYVGRISETDFSRLGRTSENIITLITCVENVPELRWCVQAKEIS